MQQSHDVHAARYVQTNMYTLSGHVVLQKCTLFVKKLCEHTINIERFPVLNFCVFQEYRESFSMSIFIYIHELHIITLFKYFKCKTLCVP